MQRLCSNFKTLLLKKTGFESRRAVITRFQLLKVWNDEFDPKISRNIAIAITRYINSTNVRERETVEFAEEIRRRLVYLHEYNCNVQRIIGKYPRSKQLNVLLVRYIELSHEVLYNARNYSPEYEKTVEEDLLRFLENMMYDVCNNIDQPIKTIVDSSTKSILKLVITVRKDYRNDKKLVCNLVNKLLSKMGLLNEVNSAKKKRTSVPMWTLLKEPEVQKICRSLCTSDYGTDDSESDCDSNADCDLVENTPKTTKGPQNTPLLPVLPQEQIKKEADEDKEQASAAKIVTIEIFDDDDENFADGYIMYLHPETKSSRSVSKCPKLETNQDFFTDTSSNQTESSGGDLKTLIAGESNLSNKISDSEVVIDLVGEDEVQLVHPKVQSNSPLIEKTSPIEESIIICSDESNDDAIPIDKEEEILNKFNDEMLLSPKIELLPSHTFNNVTVTQKSQSAHTNTKEAEKIKNGDFPRDLVLNGYTIGKVQSQNKPTPEPDSLSESLESISSGSLFNDILEVKANDFENFHSLCTSNGLLSEDDCKIICDDPLNLPKPLVETVKSENDDDDLDDDNFNKPHEGNNDGLIERCKNNHATNSGESNKFSGGCINGESNFRSYKNERIRSTLPISNSNVQKSNDPKFLSSDTNEKVPVENTQRKTPQLEERDNLLAIPDNSKTPNEKEQEVSSFDETKHAKCEESINADQIKEIIGFDPACVRNTFKIVDEDTVFDINSEYNEVIEVDPNRNTEETGLIETINYGSVEEVPQFDSVAETNRVSFEDTPISNAECVEATEVNISYEVIEIDPNHIEEVVVEQNEECSCDDEEEEGESKSVCGVTIEETHLNEEKCFDEDEATAVVHERENESNFDGTSVSEEIVDNVKEDADQGHANCQQEIKEENTGTSSLQNEVLSVTSSCVENSSNDLCVNDKQDKITSLEVSAKEETAYASPGRFEETSFALPAETITETIVESETFTCKSLEPYSSIAETVVCCEENDNKPKVILQSEITHTNNELIIKPVLQGEMNHFQITSASDDDSNDSTMLKIDKCSDFSDEESKKICTRSPKVDEAFPNPTELIALAALAAERPRLIIEAKKKGRGRPRTKPKKTTPKRPYHKKTNKKEEPPKDSPKPPTKTRKRTKASTNKKNKRVTRNRTKNSIAKPPNVGQTDGNNQVEVVRRSDVFDEDTADMDLTLIRTEPFSNGTEEGVSIHIPEAKTTCRGRHFKFLEQVEDYTIEADPTKGDENATVQASDDLAEAANGGEEMTVFDSLNLVPVKNLLTNEQMGEIMETENKECAETEGDQTNEETHTLKNPEEIQLEEDTETYEDVSIQTDATKCEDAHQQTNCDGDISDLDEKLTFRTKAALKSYEKINTKSVAVEHLEETPNLVNKNDNDEQSESLKVEESEKEALKQSESLKEESEKQALNSSFEDGTKSTISDVSEGASTKNDSTNLEEKEEIGEAPIGDKNELEKPPEETDNIEDDQINVEIASKETTTKSNEELVENEAKIEETSLEVTESEKETKYEVVVIENIENEAEAKEIDVNVDDVASKIESEDSDAMKMDGDSVEVQVEVEESTTSEEIVENEKQIDDANDATMQDTESKEDNTKLDTNSENENVESSGDDFAKIDENTTVEEKDTECVEKVDDNIKEDKNTEDLEEPPKTPHKVIEDSGKNEEDASDADVLTEDGQKSPKNKIVIKQHIKIVPGVPFLVKLVEDDGVADDVKIDEETNVDGVHDSTNSEIDNKIIEDLEESPITPLKDIEEEFSKNEEKVPIQNTLSEEESPQTHSDKMVMEDTKVALDIPCLVQLDGDEGEINKNKTIVNEEGNSKSEPKQECESNEELNDVANVETNNTVKVVDESTISANTKNEDASTIVSNDEELPLMELPTEKSSTINNKSEIAQENQVNYEEFEKSLQNDKLVVQKSTPKRAEKRKHSCKANKRNPKRIDVIIKHLKRRKAGLQKNQTRHRSGELFATDTSDESSQDKEKKDFFNFTTKKIEEKENLFSRVDNIEEAHQNGMDKTEEADKSEEKGVEITPVTNKTVDLNSDKDKILFENINTIEIPEPIEHINNFAKKNEETSPSKSPFEKITELVVDSIKESVKDEDFLCDLHQESQSPSSHLSMISAVDIEISHTEQVIDENGPYASPVGVDYSSLSLLQPNEKSPSNLDSPKVCGEPLNSTKTLKKLFGEQILLTAGDGLDGLDSTNVWTIPADSSDHSYNRIGGPLLSGKCEKSELKEVSNCNLIQLKESASGESGSDHVDVSPLDSEHIFSLTNVVDQEPSRLLHDFTVDPAVDYQFPEQDSQLGFSFISEPNQSLVDENNSVKFDYFFKSLDELDCFLHTNANQEMGNNFSLTNSDLKVIDPSFITPSCYNHQSTTSVPTNKKYSENKTTTKGITMDQLIGNCSKKVIAEPIEQYSSSMILEPKDKTLAYSSKLKISPEVTPQKPTEVKTATIEKSKAKENLSSKLENFIPSRRRTIRPPSEYVKKSSPRIPKQEESKKDTVSVGNAEIDNKNTSKSVPEKPPPVAETSKVDNKNSSRTVAEKSPPVVEPSPKVEANKNSSKTVVEKSPPVVEATKVKSPKVETNKVDDKNSRKIVEKSPPVVEATRVKSPKVETNKANNKNSAKTVVEKPPPPLVEPPKLETNKEMKIEEKPPVPQPKPKENNSHKFDIVNLLQKDTSEVHSNKFDDIKLRRRTCASKAIKEGFVEDEIEPIRISKVKKPETPKSEDEDSQAKRLKRKREEEKLNETNKRLKEDINKTTAENMISDFGDMIFFGKPLRKTTTGTTETLPNLDGIKNHVGGFVQHTRRRFFNDDDEENRRRLKENEQPDYEALFERLKREEPVNNIFNNNNKVKKPETPKPEEKEDDEAQARLLKRKREEEKRNEMKKLKDDVHRAITNTLTTDPGDIIYGKRFKITTRTPETATTHKNNNDGGGGGPSHTRRRFFDDDDDDSNRRRPKENEKPDYDALFEKLKREEPLNDIFNHNNKTSNTSSKPRDDDSHNKNHYPISSRPSSRYSGSSSSSRYTSNTSHPYGRYPDGNGLSSRHPYSDSSRHRSHKTDYKMDSHSKMVHKVESRHSNGYQGGGSYPRTNESLSYDSTNKYYTGFYGPPESFLRQSLSKKTSSQNLKPNSSDRTSYLKDLDTFLPQPKVSFNTPPLQNHSGTEMKRT